MACSPDSPHLVSAKPKPDFREEGLAIVQGLWPVAGVDEAGRGPLAGPVMAAAVILDPSRIPAGLDDSKKLTPQRRAVLFDAILESALAVAFASVGAETVDRVNIRNATLEAMRRAVNGLHLRPRLALVDGRDIPPGLPCPAAALIGGDGRSQSIAAASIVAKVMRDRMMVGCDAADGRFGFRHHVGYGTARHRLAIATHGAAPRLHRLTFAPLRER